VPTPLPEIVIQDEEKEPDLINIEIEPEIMKEVPVKELNI
jgi:hypothetical protein